MKTEPKFDKDKIWAPKCMRGRPYYITHDKFVRPCCYFTDHGWESNAPEWEGGRGDNEWPIHHVKWLRDPQTNLNNHDSIGSVFETDIYKKFFAALEKPVLNEEDLKKLPKRCIKKCYTADPTTVTASKEEEGFGYSKKTNAEKTVSPYVHGKFAGSRKLQIDMTHRCRLGCPKCSRFITHGPNQGQRREVLKDELTVEDFKKIVGDGLRFRNYNLCGSVGDAIYNPHFLDIIRYIKKHSKKSEGQEIWLHTNGSGKTEKWWRELYSMLDPERDRVVFGVDGLKDTAHMYRKFAKFDDSITAMKIGAEYGMRLNEWQFIVFKFNQHQVQQARQMAKDIGIRFYIIKSERWDINDDDELDDPLMPSKEWLPKEFVKRHNL